MIKVNGYTFGSESFSNGEVSYKPFKVDDTNRIDLLFQSNKDITDLLFAVEYIKSINPNAKNHLYMLYVPYGRMDRPIDGYLFSLKIFADIINRCGFFKVHTLDNHSPHIKELIKNVVELDLNPYIDKVLNEHFNADVIFFPDAGAMKRYPQLLNCIKERKMPFMYGEKQRVLDDSREIKYYEVYDNGINLAGKKVLIIDDICCTGGTVLEAATVLKRKGTSEINLWVAHCENNVIKYDIVRESSPINHIYTTDSIIRNYNIPEIKTMNVIFKYI